MKSKKIALDCDGVILSFWEAMCVMADKPITTKTDSWHVPWIIPYYKKVQEDKNFWSNLNPVYPDSMNIPFEFDIYLTAVPQRMEKPRLKNLLNLGFPKKPVVRSKDKWKYCKDNNIYALIDDRPSTCKEFVDNWEKEGDPLSIQFIPPYATDKWPVHGHYSVRSLKDVVRFDFIKKV